MHAYELITQISAKFGSDQLRSFVQKEVENYHSVYVCLYAYKWF